MPGAEKTKSNHGGARPGAGRADMPSGAPALRKTITIDPMDAATMIQLGGGLSMGIRLAAKIIRDQAEQRHLKNNT